MCTYNPQTSSDTNCNFSSVNSKHTKNLQTKSLLFKPSKLPRCNSSISSAWQVSSLPLLHVDWLDVRCSQLFLEHQIQYDPPHSINDESPLKSTKLTHISRGLQCRKRKRMLQIPTMRHTKRYVLSPFLSRAILSSKDAEKIWRVPRSTFTSL